MKGKLYLGKDAKESSFKKDAPKARVIHLATHAIVDDRMPMYSKLIFSQIGDDDEDGFLQAYEIYNMRLTADLVVLSACETGIGKLSRGEGLASLARAFFHAGVPSLVASLWAVDDYATTQIMENFYRELKNGLTKDKALRQAKIKYLHTAQGEKRHPYFWAGHVLMGDASAIPSYSTKFSFKWIALIIVLFVLLVLSYRKVINN